MYPPIAVENNIRRALHLLTSHLPTNRGYLNSPHTHVAINADAPVNKSSCTKPINYLYSKWGMIHSQKVTCMEHPDVAHMSHCSICELKTSIILYQSKCNSKGLNIIISKVQDAIMCNDNTAEQVVTIGESKR